MAYRYEGHIPRGSTMREKSEFSPTATQKHASSLRIPEDTTWPKIPERRIHENVVSGGNKAPCVVTLSGKPQKNRTLVQLPHSQFVKAAPRRNELECHNSANRSAPLQSNPREGRANAALAAQITASSQSGAKKQMEKDIKDKSDHLKSAANTDPAKGCERSVLEDSKTAHEQLDNASDEAAKHNSTIINQDACHPNNKFKVTNCSNSEGSSEVKKSSDAQDDRDLKNVMNEQYAIAKNDSDKIKKCSAPSSICSSVSPDHQNSSERQWAPGISRSSRLHASETTDSELYSSDTTKSGVTQTSTDRRTRHSDIKGFKERDYSRKCCYRSSKSPIKKADQNSCCGSSVRCDKCHNPRKPRHRSEPQIGDTPTSRRCWTAHGKPVCCCAKDFHRVASDSNCWSTMHASEFSSKELTRRAQYSLQEPNDALSYPGALQALLSREGDDAKREEIALKVQMLLENGYAEKRKKLAEESSVYAYQVAMGAPQIKRRRSSKDGQVTYKVDALTLFSGACNQTEASPAVCATAREKLVAIKGGSSQSAARTLAHVHKSNPPGEKQADNRLFKLKTAVALSCAILVLILLLPTIYDYFFYEEYEPYEELSYIELIFEYIISSFQEAFGGLFDLISKVFFHSTINVDVSSSTLLSLFRTIGINKTTMKVRSEDIFRLQLTHTKKTR